MENKIKPMSREVAAHLILRLQNPQYHSNERITISFDASYKTFGERYLTIECATDDEHHNEPCVDVYRVNAEAWCEAMLGNFMGIQPDDPSSLPGWCPRLGEWYDWHQYLDIKPGKWVVDCGNGPEDTRFEYDEPSNSYVWRASGKPEKIFIDRYF